MVSINYSAREVCCKIVYYGPGLSGKTTNLQYVHAKVPQTTRGKLISLATEADRTLYFDFLPINIGTINGFQAKFQLYTVPGQVYYNATRKLVLRGVDGLVFVADSQPDKMDENIESWSNLEENLREYGYNLSELPVVIQYNKRDLPGVLTVDELNARLNPAGRPIFEASASLGHGVFDTLKLIIKMVLDKAKQTSVVRPQVVSTPASPSGVSYGSDAGNDTRPNPGVAGPPEPVKESVYRPYPGAGRTGKVAVQAPPVGNSTVGVNAVGTQPVNAYDRIPSSTPAPSRPVRTTVTNAAPHMAPSLKVRETKKRGFFKRMFGIK